MMNGLEMRRKWLSRSSDSPLTELVGPFSPSRREAELREVTMAAPATPWLETGPRRLYEGAIALLADACLTSAVHTTGAGGHRP